MGIFQVDMFRNFILKASQISYSESLPILRRITETNQKHLAHEF